MTGKQLIKLLQLAGENKEVIVVDEYGINRTFDVSRVIHAGEDKIIISIEGYEKN